MDKKKIVEVYKRYRKSLSVEGSDIIGNFEAIHKWLMENCEDKDVQVTLNYGSVCKALKTAEKQKLNYRNNSSGVWNGSVAKMGYQLAKATYKASKDGDKQKFKDCLTDLFGLFSETENKPPLFLYVCYCYFLTEVGHSFFYSMEKDADQLIKKFAEEEGEKVAL